MATMRDEQSGTGEPGTDRHANDTPSISASTENGHKWTPATTPTTTATGQPSLRLLIFLGTRQGRHHKSNAGPPWQIYVTGVKSGSNLGKEGQRMARHRRHVP